MSDGLVLIVDDSPLVRKALRRRLEEEGWRCLEAENGADGAVQAITHRPRLVITDLEMPVMDGFQLARLLKSDPTTASMPVLVLTSHGEASSRFWSLHTGADRFVTKSEDFTQLIQAVRELWPDGEEKDEEPVSAVERAPDPLEIIGRVARQLDARLLETTVAQNLLEQGVVAEDLTDAVAGVLDVLETVVDAVALAIVITEIGGEPMLFLRSRPEADHGRSDSAGHIILDGLGMADRSPVRIVELSPLRGRGGGSPRQVEPGLPRFFRLPLRDAEGALAVLPTSQGFTEVPSDLVAHLTSEIGLVLDNARLAQRLRELSTLDGLTGLLNHRAVLERLEQEMARCERYGGEVTVVLLDLDHFKAVNDRWGHLAGDQVLRGVAERLKAELRSTDVAGRYGGEEFLVVLPSSGLETGRIVAERLRRALAESPIIHEDEAIQVPASFGVAALGEAADGTLGELLGLADERLYQAKREGRNCVKP